LTDIRPFKCIRPQADLVQEIASVPYDVVSTVEAKELAENNPNSFLRIIRSEIEFSEDVNPYSQAVYERSRDNFDSFLQKGLLFEDSQEDLYIYQLQMDSHIQTGIVGCSSVDEYDQGLIKIHEKTRPQKENDRVQHMLTLGAHAGPVFLTYRQTDSLKDLVKNECAGTPLYSFTAPDGIAHRIWKARDWSSISQAFRSISASYVADGHHRAKSASRCRAEIRSSDSSYSKEDACNFFLTVLFPHDELQILPYNRIIKKLPAGPAEILDNIRTGFIVKEATAAPSKKGRCSLYLDGKWYGINLETGENPAENPVAGLDVSILQNRILNPVFGIEDPRTDSNIDFIGGIRGTDELERLVDSGEAGAAFSLYPLAVNDLIQIADQGLLMPPKSTWFEPKLRSGLFVHRFRI
jgi:uncharacterized protein (DUF1015 family)